MVNNKSIGIIDIQRDTGGVPTRDSVCTYTVRTRCHGEVREAKVQHRYGDGALMLMRKALVAVTDEVPADV
jgi:hypothetical protein